MKRTRFVFQERKMGQGLLVKLDFESRPKCDPGEGYRLSSSGSGSGSGMAHLFVGSNSKGLYDLGSIDSPTSPLDLMMFPWLRDTIRSPRDRPPRQNSWDCMKAGLRSIVDNLDDDERDLFGRASGSSCGKSIVFGPKLRLKELNGGDSSVVFEIGETRFRSDRFGNFLSCSVDSCSFENHRSQSIRKSPGAGFLIVVKGSDHHLPGSDIELSEDYTCVISHGPGATTKTTHIFDDRVLECFHLNDCAGMSITEQAEGINPSLDPLNGFLRTCYACKKPLVEGEDIYMYRSVMSFLCRP